MILKSSKPNILTVESRFAFLAIRRMDACLRKKLGATKTDDSGLLLTFDIIKVFSYKKAEFTLSIDNWFPNEISVIFDENTDPEIISEVKSSLEQIRFWI